MNTIIYIFFLIVIVLLISYLVYIKLDNHKSNLNRVEILNRVINGNLNSRILTDPNKKESEIDFLINNLINKFQNTIIEYNKNESKRKQLLSNISHDVRTPLTSIVGYLDAIQNSLITSEEEKEKYINIANRKARQLKVTLDDIFELARSEANELSFIKKQVEINKFLKDNLIEFIPIIEKNNIEIINNIPDDEYYVMVDEYSLKRAFQNIIQNSIQHGSIGGIIGINVEENNLEYKIEIWDKGPGIVESEIDKIFLRLHKNNNSEGNYGLGLAIAKTMIEKNNGRIIVKSIPHIKTSFIVYLKHS